LIKLLTQVINITVKEKTKTPTNNMENEKTAEELEREKQLAEEKSEDNEEKGDEEEKNEEKSPYELYLEQLEGEIKSKEDAIKQAEAEKAKAEEIARQKNGAIDEERQKRKELEEELKKKSVGLTEEEINRILDERENKREEINKVNQLTTDEKEREAIRKTMELKKVSAEDAFAIVNSHIIKEYRENDEVDTDSFVANVMAGGINSPKGGVKNKLRLAAEEGLTDEEKKKLDL